MHVTLTLSARNISRDQLRALIQAIRDWEQGVGGNEPCGIRCETNPRMTVDETQKLLSEIHPDFARRAVYRESPTRVLRLGQRMLTVGGKLIGTCDQLSLEIAEGTAQEIEELENAQVISLVRMTKG